MTLAQVESIGAEGDRFGRFFVLERLGAGGMGVVIAAYDPDLDRKVAIKVLRPDGLLARTELREQMIREAQAMARLAHPNVVAVHEVGTIDELASPRGRVFFLVMELIEGGTLKDWLKTPRPWREVVRVLGAAGRGLAAAHAHGLVHRDFKPHNVLVGSDGRVRVTDFGVVGVAGTTDSVAVGTPAYMAPEQHAPAVVDARADQFAFCATLYEALYGRPAFTGTPDELRLAVASGAPPAPAGSGVPAWLYAIVARGLSADPGARFADMAELLARLEHDPRRTLRRAAIGTSVLSLAALAAIGWSREAPRADIAADPCDATSGAAVAAAWGPAQRTALAAAFARVQPAIATETFARVAQRLDRYAAALHAERDRVCTQRHAAPAALRPRYEGPLACVDRRTEQLAALTAVLARADGAIVQNAVAAVSSLDPPGGCASVERAATISTAPIGGPNERLARARSLLDAGLARDAAELARALLDDASGELEARAALLLGRAERELGDGKAAEDALLRALRKASAAGLDDVVARAYSELAWVVSYLQGRPADALAMQPFVDAAIARAGSPAQLRAFAAFAAGSALVELGRYAEALPHLELARELWTSELDPTHPEAARTLLTIGNVQSYQGDLVAAETTYREVIRLRENSLGPHHPALAGPLANLGGQLVDRGRADEARALCERGLALVDPAATSTAGPRGYLLRCIGRAQHHLGQLADAQATLERAAALFDGATNARAAYALVDLCELALTRGDPAAALALAERARAAFGADEPPAAAAPGAAPTEHPDHGFAYACRGRARLERGELAGARADLERALALGAVLSSPARRGETRLALARTYAALGVAPGPRDELARAAIADLTEAGLPARAEAARTALATPTPR